MITVRGEQGEETLSLEEFEARVRRGQIAPTTPVQFAILTGERWVDARELELFRRLYEPARIHFRRAFTLRGIPGITLGLCTACVLVFFALAGGQRALPVDTLIRAGAKVSANVFELGQWWRLWTANLLHRDVLHLVFNTFFLFNVGGTIENAYRRRDYLLIVVASALGTTLTSALMSSEPSVGISGVVLGCFGAASVFGVKYGDILPVRYRRYFAGGVLPYALFILYVGLATPSTDNWGHLGGVLAGALAAVPLEPKLLMLGRAPEPWWRRWAPALTAAALVVATMILGALARWTEPRFAELVERESGLALVYPARWSFGENHLGYPAAGNVLGASVGVRARREARVAQTLAALERRFFEQDLAGPEQSGAITAVVVRSRHERMISGLPALELVIELESRAGRHVSRNLLVARGQHSYVIVLSAPEPFAEAYQPIFERMIARVVLLEPPALAEKRRVAEAFPGMSSAHVELGLEWEAFGQAERAAEAYRAALVALPDQPDALLGLVRLAVDYGGDLDAAATIAARLAERRPDDVELANLRASLCERQGDRAGARAVLETALEHTPEAAELRERLLGL